MFYNNILKSKTKLFSALIILMVFVFGLVFKIGEAGSSTCALCPQFNICPQDKETLRLKNRTRGDTEWQDPISANPGDKVAFDVYYHNGITGSVAKNTKIRLDFPDTPKSQIITTAYLWADNASYVSDTGTINLSSPQKLVFESTAKWYPNQGTTAINVPVTQINPCSILVDIGDIQGNWDYQGHVVFEARIMPNPPTVITKPAVATY